MYKPGGVGPPAQASGGPPPLESGVGALGWPRNAHFRSFSTGFIVFLYFPPPGSWISGGRRSPPNLQFSSVFTGVFIFSPPEIGIHRIRHVAQNLVLLTVFKVFYISPPRKLDPNGSKTWFYQGFSSLFTFPEGFPVSRPSSLQGITLRSLKSLKP